MTQFIDTMIITLFALFCFVFSMLFLNIQQPIEATILIFLSVGSFGLAGYRATH